MYKMIILIKKSVDDELLQSIKNNLLKSLEDLTKQKIIIGEIEAAALMEEPYNKYCEVSVKEKSEMDKLLSSPDGKSFTNSVNSLKNHLSLFFINYEGK